MCPIGADGGHFGGGVGKNFHDLRGTAATRLCLAGFDDREISEMIGWSVARVAEVRRKYVDKRLIVRNAVERLIYMNKRTQEEQEL